MPQMQTQAGPIDDVYRLLRRGAAPVSEADRQNAVRIIAQQTGQTEEQARATLDRWQREYQETMANAERQAREAAEKTAKTLAQGSLWAFLALVIGAICAAIGGSLGARRDLSHY
jgi:Flp pilus assembly protein TadB